MEQVLVVLVLALDFAHKKLLEQQVVVELVDLDDDRKDFVGS